MPDETEQDPILTLLVIDDSEDDRLLYRRTLGKCKDSRYDIVEVVDGEAGLAALRARIPDCILLDYSLPGHNGIEVLKRIRADHPFLSVVMLTGQGSEAVAVAVMQEGAQNYIAKSTITPEALQRVINVAIEHCALHKRIDDQRASLEIFSRALAHDLKEPVRTIRSFVELIEQYETVSEKGAHYLEHVRTAAERMHRLIDTVYLYTRLDDPKLMTQEDCDMNALLGEVEDNLNHLIRERRTVITHDTLPAIHGNRTQLMQVFQNLICNAIQHGKEGIKVHISAVMQDKEWLFSVRDNGPGIPAEQQDKIFAPFARLKNNEGQGTGLGLAICRKIIELHHGKIWCGAAAGGGTEFSFLLPDALTAHTGNSDAAQPENAAPGKIDMKLANILLVDDSRADVEITRFRLFERSGLQCNLFVARDGEEAISLLREQTQSSAPIDLMLLDINMPEMDGFEVLRQVRADKNLNGVVVLMCSGSIYDKDMERAQALGAAGYLVKPIEFSRLQSFISHTPEFRLSQGGEGYSLLRAG